MSGYTRPQCSRVVGRMQEARRQQISREAVLLCDRSKHLLVQSKG